MDYHRLGLGDASSLVRAVRIIDWGTNIILDCLYDPLGERKPYQLIFRGCSRWGVEMIPDAPVKEQEADLIGFHMGQDACREPAIVTTDLFELQVTYQEFQCVKAWATTGSVAMANNAERLAQVSFGTP